MEHIRLQYLPACRMVTSGIGFFGDEKFTRFEKFLSMAKNDTPYPMDFLTGNENGMEWLYLYRDGMDTHGLDVVDFPAGLYAVICGIDSQSNETEMAAVSDFIEKHGLVRDYNRPEMGHIIGNDETKEVLGYEQMDYWTPVKKRETDMSMVTQQAENCMTGSSQQQFTAKGKNMDCSHLHEFILQTFDFNGIDVDLVRWSDTVWCGKIGYADNNTDEPDVEKIAQEASIIFPKNTPNRCEKNWEVCISLNYLSKERPNGVMFGFLVQTEEQPGCYDVIKVPSSLYMRIRICDETFRALDVEPWTGGIPPYQWIGEIIAPRYGYEYGDDTLPIFEYYFLNPENNNIESCDLYVPVCEK